MSTYFPDLAGHSDWIKANPNRWYRITRREDSIGWGLVSAEVMSVGEGRRRWGMETVYMRREIPNTDKGAVLALKEHDFIFHTLLAQKQGERAQIGELLDVLRDAQATQ